MSVPASNDELTAWVALHSVEGMGAASLGRLIARFGSPEGVLRASAQELHAVPKVPTMVLGGVGRAAERLPRHRAVAEHLISREREARRKLASESRTELLDAVEQVQAGLMTAGMLSGTEAMSSLSILRLGAVLDLGISLSSRTFSELLASMRLGFSGSAEPGQDARAVGSIEDDIQRARLVREKLISERQSAASAREQET